MPAVPEYTDAPHFASTAALEAAVAVDGNWSALSSFVVSGLSVAQSGPDRIYYVQRYLGERRVPYDIRRLRASVHEVMRRMGQPVVIKHMFNDHDAKVGLAQPSPSAHSAYGQQVRNRDPYSYGTGYCSIELSPDEWIEPITGKIVTAALSPGPQYVQAPMYRGYGPGFLTYLIEPDVPLDAFKLSSAGAIVKTQSQTVKAPWFPEINDNDLIINVELCDGLISETRERYLAKLSSPVTIRGLDRRGRHERYDNGNRFVVNQQLEMSRLPETNVLMQVPVDR